ncbi:uncharacterized protein LOC133311940 [Gastrolobium bilobum]|uniref:uncharacterized protein LOC133311940 n=1 Tax=Gastrolobium bilobum TaxID=150636 RepID=UPI002AB1DEC3|nr:uncharacterized protein LOC133311940 [Gastrolobium bilobum]
MNVLDSNVEALAINYLSYGMLTTLNNLWTWVALLTAALSFWKIRSVGSLKPKPDEPSFVGSDPVKVPLTPEAVTAVIEPARQTVVVGDDVDAVRKGKFTVYYEEDMQCGRGGEGLLTAAEDWEEREGSESEWWSKWERVLKLRNGENENGWYTCQDLTELNGNVVRLWDSGLSFGGGSFTRESWCSTSCIHVW